MLIKGEVVIIEGDNLCAKNRIKGLVKKIERDYDDEEFYNLEMVATLEKDKTPLNFNAYSNMNTNAIPKKWGYFLGMTIGRRAQGWTTFP